MAEFAVHGSSSAEGMTTVVGRCYAGPLRVGQRFCTAYRTDASGARGESRPISLVLTRIFAYQHELDEVDAGLTAQLALEGELDVAMDWVLVTE